MLISGGDYHSDVRWMLELQPFKATPCVLQYKQHMETQILYSHSNEIYNPSNSAPTKILQAESNFHFHNLSLTRESVYAQTNKLLILGF
jgi:hypothetical protein